MIDGTTFSIQVESHSTIAQVKSKVKETLDRRNRHATTFDLVFAGKQLKDDETVEGKNLSKQSTLHILFKGKVYAPAREPSRGGEEGEGEEHTSGQKAEEDEGEEEDEEEDADEELEKGVAASASGGGGGQSKAPAPPHLRINPFDGKQEFDGADGWAVANGMSVDEVQAWYRRARRELRWQSWKNENRLVYLLNRFSGFEAEVAEFLTEKMGRTALGNASMWQSVPECLRALDLQLRAVFVNPHLKTSAPPLLGDEVDGPFVLGYVQVSQMPVALREKAGPRVMDKAKTQREGRSLGLHFDAKAYGDVIITTTIFGEVSIQLKNRTDIALPLELVGLERGSGTDGGDAHMSCGDAYSIAGKARWKMLHDAIVPPSAPAINGLDEAMGGGIARVSATNRYFRRTFLELCRRGAFSGAPPQAILPSALPQPFDYVDAPYYLKGAIDEAHLYTYPAVVLRVDSASCMLTLQYLSDGLGADTDGEAFHIADQVPASHVLPTHPTIRSLLTSEECSWTRKSLRLVESIREQGVEAFLNGHSRM